MTNIFGWLGELLVLSLLVPHMLRSQRHTFCGPRYVVGMVSGIRGRATSGHRFRLRGLAMSKVFPSNGESIRSRGTNRHLIEPLMSLAITGVPPRGFMTNVFQIS